ncbi:hypothetical protein THAOC_05208, partial [Thalassiosira oceanica]
IIKTLASHQRQKLDPLPSTASPRSAPSTTLLLHFISSSKKEMGHPQPPTSIQTDNKTAEGVINTKSNPNTPRLWTCAFTGSIQGRDTLRQPAPLLPRETTSQNITLLSITRAYAAAHRSTPSMKHANA